MSTLLPGFLRGNSSSNDGSGVVATRRQSVSASTNTASIVASVTSPPTPAVPEFVGSNEILEWSRRLYSINLSKREIEQLVMNYLIIEGFKDAAMKFSQETGIKPSTDLAAIDERMQIRQAIQAGDIAVAIDKINDLNPDLLDSLPKLSFHLKQQAMIEMVRGGDVMGALTFAQEELAPRAEAHPEFLRDLEKTMALLVFADQQLTGKILLKPALKELLDPTHRLTVANEVNTALLSLQSQENESKLPILLRLLHHLQEQMGSKMIFPKIVDYTNATFEPALLTPDQVDAASVKTRAMAFANL